MKNKNTCSLFFCVKTITVLQLILNIFKANLNKIYNFQEVLDKSLHFNKEPMILRDTLTEPGFCHNGTKYTER